MKLIDFFCGAGLASSGLRRAGFDHVFGVDWDPWARLSYSSNFGVPCEGQDMLDGDEIGNVLRRHGVRASFDGLAWLSPPCNPFSIDNMNGDDGDKLGASAGLLLAAVEVAGQMPRAWVAVENVRGLLVREGRPYYDALVGGLRKKGRAVTEWALDARDLGLPQVRRRIFVIAAPAGRATDLALPRRRKWPVLRDAIHPDSGFVDPDPEAFPLRRNELLLFAGIPPGGNWSSTLLGRKYAGIRFRGRRPSGDLLRRLSWDTAAPCVVATKPDGYRTRGTTVHPEEPRHLSVGEMRALQGVSPSHVIAGPLAARIRQVGNGVAVPMAEAVGRAILAAE